MRCPHGGRGAITGWEDVGVGGGVRGQGRDCCELLVFQQRPQMGSGLGLMKEKVGGVELMVGSVLKILACLHQTLVGEIEAAGGAALAVKMDVADGEQVKAGFKQVVEKFGRLDILVNNAAITRDGLSMRMKQDDWEAVLKTNLTGAHLCIQQALSTMMRARAGRIINISSVVAQSGNAGQANYVAAKAGLIGLTKAVAIEITGEFKRKLPVEPWKRASPKLNTPPSDASNQ